jgi:hypothetical protein
VPDTTRVGRLEARMTSVERTLRNAERYLLGTLFLTIGTLIGIIVELTILATKGH